MPLNRVITIPSFQQTFWEGLGGLGGVGVGFNAAQMQCGFNVAAGRAFWVLELSPVTDATQIIQGDFNMDPLYQTTTLNPATGPGPATTSVTMQFYMIEEFPFLGWGPGLDRVPGQTVNGLPTNNVQFIETPIGDQFSITEAEYAAFAAGAPRDEFLGNFSRALSDAFFGAGASHRFRGPSMPDGGAELVGVSLWPVAWVNSTGGDAYTLAGPDMTMRAEVLPELTGLDGLQYNRAQSRVDRCRKCGLPSLRQEWVRDGYSKLLVCPNCWDPKQRDEDRQPVQPEDPLGINPTD